jgi:hypothetical protein
MTVVIPCGLTQATQEHCLQSYAFRSQPKILPDPNRVNSLPSKVMMMMTISNMTNHLSIISTLLMKVMTPFLIVPTITTCHQISFAKMKKPIPSQKVQVDLMLAPVDLMTPIQALSFFQMTKQHSALPPQFPKDKANHVKLELVNLVLETVAPLHLFHKIAQWATRANSRGHIFKPDDCLHYQMYLKDLTKRLKLESLSHTMEDVLLPWGGKVKFPVFEFRAMFQNLIDDPRLRKELLIDWNNPSSIPPYYKDYLDEIHSMEWYNDTYKLYNIQDGMFVVLCGLIFCLDQCCWK